MTTKGYRLQIGSGVFGYGPFQYRRADIKRSLKLRIDSHISNHEFIYMHPEPDVDFIIYPDDHHYYMFTSLQKLKNILGCSLKGFLELGFEIWEHELSEVLPSQIGYSTLQMVASEDQVVQSNLIEL